MAKKIIILLDGTSNQITADQTNILRLYRTLKKSQNQLVYYNPGVGTLQAEQSWSKSLQWLFEFWGRLTGWGLDRSVKEAYKFIVENYDKGEGGERDEIYIFGFSRGAYSGRVLAGFIHAFGLLEPRNLNLLRYAYRAYKRIGESGAEDKFSELRQYERILISDHPKIRCLGIFDTVSSIIESGGVLPRLQKHAFTARNPSVESVRHAVALSERRTMFRPKLWPLDQPYRNNKFDSKTGVPQDAKEVWFTGSHGDVGGGYPEEQSGLAKIPMHWMIKETEDLGLEFTSRTVNEIVLGKNSRKTYVGPNPLANENDSMSLAWQILEWVPQLKLKGANGNAVFGLFFPRAERRSIPDGAVMHTSVLERFNKNDD